MSNNLRKLIEALESNETTFLGHMFEKDMERISDISIKAGNKAICFDAGDIDSLCYFKPINELVRLPFNFCWIEMLSTALGENNPIVWGHLVWNDKEEKINGLVWGKVQQKWKFFFAWADGDFGGSKIAFNPTDIPHLLMQNTICLVRTFLTVLNCKNITKREINPPEMLQKARVKRGKKPLFSYWVLELKLPKIANNQCGGKGTHDSPRVHLCMGHLKKRKTGWFWWQPHVRGDKSKGVVHKSYAAKYLLQE